MHNVAFKHPFNQTTIPTLELVDDDVTSNLRRSLQQRRAKKKDHQSPWPLSLSPTKNLAYPPHNFASFHWFETNSCPAGC